MLHVAPSIQETGRLVLFNNFHYSYIFLYNNVVQ